MNTMKATRKDSGRRSISRRQPFTLVEMMVVIVIIAIVIGIAVPAFQKMGSGSSVRAGTRILSAQIRLTRQYAITQRKTMALLLPAREITKLDVENCYTAMKPAIVDFDSTTNTATFVAWVPNTKWTRIPRGAVIAEVDGDVGIADASGPTEVPDDNSPCTVSISTADMTDLQEGLGSSTVSIRAIVFSTTGRVLGPSPAANATVAQLSGTLNGSTWVWISKNKGTTNKADWATPNQFNININTFTGRIKIITPDIYP
jgi:prepilin-type N-terminal cleavage/methylation domain-containing protein